METERSAPARNTFGSVLFINSTVYLRTPRKGGWGGRSEREGGRFINQGL